MNIKDPTEILTGWQVNCGRLGILVRSQRDPYWIVPHCDPRDIRVKSQYYRGRIPGTGCMVSGSLPDPTVMSLGLCPEFGPARSYQNPIGILGG